MEVLNESVTVAQLQSNHKHTVDMLEAKHKQKHDEVSLYEARHNENSIVLDS